jgi:hypothetical protein
MSDPFVPSNEKPRRSWQEIAIDLSRESDPQKIAELSHEMNDAMLEDERLKARARLRGSPLYVSSRWRIVA